MCHFFCATKNVPLSEVQPAQIVVQHKEGYSERAISQKIAKMLFIMQLLNFGVQRLTGTPPPKNLVA